MKLKIALLSIILAVTSTTFAGNDCDKYDKHEKNCHKHNHNHCRTNIVNVTVTRTNVVSFNRTNVVNLTNRVVTTVLQTNTVTQIVTFTNVITDTNFVTSSLVNLPTADYPLVANHTYTLYVTSDTNPRWVRWGKIKSTDTEVARLILPLDLVKNVYWQLVDTTPGFPRSAVVPVEPTNEFRNSYLALVKGKVYKVPTTLP